jgi:trehalose-6-phosphatase
VTAKAASSEPCGVISPDEYAQELLEAVVAARKAGDIVVLGSDIDGTLIETPGTGEMGTLPDELYEALKRLKQDPNFLSC